MLYIPLNHLKPHMILAKDLPSGKFSFSLLRKGQPLSAKIISRLHRLGIQGVYVQSTASEGIYAEELIDPEAQVRILEEIEKQFEACVKDSLMPELHGSFAKIAADLVAGVMAKDELLLNVIDIRDYDSYTSSHSMHVALTSVLIGAQLSYTETQLEHLAMCGLLHDIGKLEIPLEIVNKPAKLTEEESQIMRTHPESATMRLRKLYTFPFAVMSAIETHHERIDGQGYPNRLTGDQIPTFGKILAIADVYDALLSNRPYRKAWLPSQAIEYMMGHVDLQFDHDLLQNFLQIACCYPVGSLVELSNGFLAIVAKNTRGHMLRPIVRVVSPPVHRDEEIDLATDFRYLSITVVQAIQAHTALPPDLFD